MSNFIDKVVRICGEELEFFGEGAKKEYQSSVFKRVGDYWDELAKIDDFKVWKGYNGKSDVTFKADGSVKKNKNQPWSAAFISFVAKKAGAGDRFKYSPAHSRYIVAALKAAKDGDTDAPFLARRHTSYAPKIGDLIACERRSGDDATFDNYPSFVSAGKFEAHCDFIVEFDAERKHAITVGGNVGHSVKRKSWPLNSRGRIGNHDPGSESAKVICVIETLI